MPALAGVVASAGPAASETAPLAAASGQKQRGTYLVIVMLKAAPGSHAAAAERVLASLRGHHVRVNRRFGVTPGIALTVDGEALRILRAHPDVASVHEDRPSPPGGAR